MPAGINIISQYTPNYILPLIFSCAALLGAIFLIVYGLAYWRSKSWIKFADVIKPLVWGIVFLVLSLLYLITCIHKTQIADTRYEVTFTSSANMEEITNMFDIIDVEDNVFTIVYK